MRHRLQSVALLLPLLLLVCGAAPSPSAMMSSGLPTPADLVSRAPESAWRDIAPDSLMLLELAGGHEVAIELAPDFAPVHVANIRGLLAAHGFDNTSINRVQDDYVVQWGDGAGRKRRPAGIAAHPPAEYERPLAGLTLTRLSGPDAYAPAVGFAQDWPVGADPKAPGGGRVWLAHCYGMVGVGRDLPPDTGDGSELYAVIGQAPRQLDRNIALVGRVVGGITALDTLPRGTADLGFYAEPSQRTAILRAKLASELPPGARPHWQAMRTASPAFAAYARARADRRDAFYVRPAGGVDLCNVPVPTRQVAFHPAASGR